MFISSCGLWHAILPATKSMPKEMLPIVNKPLIQYGVEEALSAGLTQIGFVTGRGKRALEDHFDTNYELEHQIAGSSKETLLSGIRGLIEQCSFSYTRQTEMKGLGHAILTGEPLVGDEPFAVVLADDFCVHEPNSVLEQMVALHETHGCSIVAVEEVPWEKTASYGIVSGEALGDDLVRVTAMVEKPEPSAAPSNLAVIGRYILTPDIFEILKSIPPGRNGEIQITDALNEQAKAGQVLAYRFKGRRFDCGSIEGFVAATDYIYRHHYEKGENYPRS
jgi:UTP--glucose-1-phosphate uridylyltransferase